MSLIICQIIEELECLPPQMQEEALDFVRFLHNKSTQADLKPHDKEPNGKKVSEIMMEIAARGTAFRDIKDPAAWQREIRKDRPLPGRDE
jgi:hypothetical protein